LAIRTAFQIFAIVGSCLGQTANDYFHTGAQFYVFEKNQECKATLAEGLAKYPGDPKMNALKGKIKEEDQKKQNQGNQDKNKQDKQKGNDKNDNSKQNQDKNEQDKNDQKKDQQKQDQQQGQENKDNQENQKPEPTPQQQKQEDMKKQEAKRLIEQYSDDDKELNKKPEKQGAAVERKNAKDW